jgi:hypothetical protein
VRSSTLFALVPILALSLVACEDPAARQWPALVFTDTVTLAVPSAELRCDIAPEHTAVDITVAGQGFGIQGGRAPECPQDAERWDFALRFRDGSLVLLPAGAIGIENRAGLSERLEAGLRFEDVREVPRNTRFVTDRHVALQQGAIYVARSRVFGAMVGACQQFSKIQPLELDMEMRTATLQIATNQNCGDQRLVATD